MGWVSVEYFVLLVQVGVALSYALWAVSQSFMLFVVARIIGGLSKGNVSLSTAIVTDVTSAEKRSKGMVSVTTGKVIIILACMGLCAGRGNGILRKIRFFLSHFPGPHVLLSNDM